MGTCCSAVPPDHSYSAIGANSTQNNATPHGDSDDDNVAGVPRKCDHEIHSESRSLINTSESKDSEEDEDQHRNVINMDLHDVKLDDAHLINYDLPKVAQQDNAFEDESAQIFIPKAEPNKLSPRRSAHSPKSMDDMIKLSRIDTSKSLDNSPQSKENLQQPIANTAKATENISQISPKSKESTMKSMKNALKSIENTPKSSQNPLQLRKDPAKSLQNTINSMSDSPVSVEEPPVNEAIDESKDGATSPTDDICTDSIADLHTSDDIKQKKRKKSTHSIYASMRIINDYGGNEHIRRLRKIYMKNMPKVKKPKSRHTVKKSMEIIANHRDLELLKLKKKYKRNKRKQKKKENENEKVDYLKIQQELKTAAIRRRKSAHSVRRSSMIINEYKGNNDIWILRKKYMEQYQRNSVAKGHLIPAKPKNIDAFMNEYTLQIHDELCEYIAPYTHYVGMAEFEDAKELCIEIKFTSNASGNIKGKRVMIKERNVVQGNAKIHKDVIWNDNSAKYEGCIRFQWIDVCDDVVTKLIFNTNNNYLDMDHLYFEGKCYQYRRGLFADDVELEQMNKTQLKQVRKGVFNMVCISMRKRNFCKRDALCNYHEIDIWRMNDKQLQIIPKYIKCMNITSVKMHQAYASNNNSL